MLRIKYRPARPKLRAAEQRAGGGPQGAPKKRPWTAIQGARDSGPRLRAARPTSRAAEQPAGRGPRGTPKKRPGTAIGGYENAGLPRFIGERFDEKSV